MVPTGRHSAFKNFIPLYSQSDGCRQYWRLSSFHTVPCLVLTFSTKKGVVNWRCNRLGGILERQSIERSSYAFIYSYLLCLVDFKKGKREQRIWDEPGGHVQELSYILHLCFVNGDVPLTLICQWAIWELLWWGYVRSSFSSVCWSILCDLHHINFVLTLPAFFPPV